MRRVLPLLVLLLLSPGLAMAQAVNGSGGGGGGGGGGGSPVGGSLAIQSYGTSSTFAGSQNATLDSSGNMTLGGQLTLTAAINPNGTTNALDVASSVLNPSSEAQGIGITFQTNITTSGITSETQALRAYNAINTNGYTWGTEVISSALYGHTFANSTVAGGVVNGIVGVTAMVGNTGTDLVNNAYDVWLHKPDLNTGGGTITNLWGIYQDSVGAGTGVTNVVGAAFVGNVGVGTTTNLPQAAFHAYSTANSGTTFRGLEVQNTSTTTGSTADIDFLVGAANVVTAPMAYISARQVSGVDQLVFGVDGATSTDDVMVMTRPTGSSWGLSIGHGSAAAATGLTLDVNGVISGTQIDVAGSQIAFSNLAGTLSVPTQLPYGSASVFGALECGAGTSCSAGVLSVVGAGLGNVTGPGSSTANHLPTFADASGELLADSGYSVVAVSQPIETVYAVTTSSIAIPANAHFVLIVAEGQGGCGGGGASLTGTASGSGGGGGGGGAVKYSGLIPVSQISGTIAVTIGTSCTAAAAGASGSVGANTTVAVTGIDSIVAAGGGGGGTGSTTTSGGGGSAGTGTVGGSSTGSGAGAAGTNNGVTGGAGGNGTAASVPIVGGGGAGSSAVGVAGTGGGSMQGGSGGGAGGGWNAGTPAAGGLAAKVASTSYIAGGAATGANGSNGTASYGAFGGDGGGGGGAIASGTGGVGGNGGAGGGGGGGGGAGTTGGAGGVGGQAQAKIDFF